jgi:hypothetical protein
MKLELKHLAGYLPYGLKIQGVTHVEIAELSCCTKTGVNITTRSFQYGMWSDIFDIKPILRPLSDLTKEIEINGKKFVPNYILNNSFRAGSKDLMPYKYTGYNVELNIETENYSQTIDLFDGFLIVQKLLEWHFDIYGLIEPGLAIDINTLDKYKL